MAPMLSPGVISMGVCGVEGARFRLVERETKRTITIFESFDLHLKGRAQHAGSKLIRGFPISTCRWGAAKANV